MLFAEKNTETKMVAIIDDFPALLFLLIRTEMPLAGFVYIPKSGRASRCVGTLTKKRICF